MALFHYTVFCKDLSEEPNSTMHIASVQAENSKEAAGLGRAQCASDWGYEDEKEVSVIGVAEGDVVINMWDDDGLEI